MSFPFDADCGLHFRAIGSVAEYALRMRQLPTSGFLDYKVDRGHLDPAISTGSSGGWLTSTGAKPGHARSRGGRIGNLRNATRENFRQSRRFVGVTLRRRVERDPDLYQLELQGPRRIDCPEGSGPEKSWTDTGTFIWNTST